ncbi:MAG: hypothetical protein AAF485_14545 [Chloroflexota bacterium]
MDQTERQKVVIDYAKIRSTDELVKWAIEAFKVPSDRTETALRFILTLFQHIGSHKYRFEVLELNHHLQSDEVRSLLEGQSGWKHILGFHLDRDYGVTVRFVKEKYKA